MKDVTLSEIKNYATVVSEPDDDMGNIFTDSIKSFFDSRIPVEGIITSGTEESETEESKKDIGTKTSLLIEGKKEKDRLQSLIKYRKPNVINVDSYYDSVDEYYGSIKSISPQDNEFTALLRQSNDDCNAEEIEATFDMDSIQESDRKLLFVGAQITWLVGKERKINNISGTYKLGGITNISRLQFRRTRLLNKKQRNRIEEQANEWSKFFAGHD